MTLPGDGVCDLINSREEKTGKWQFAPRSQICKEITYVHHEIFSFYYLGIVVWGNFFLSFLKSSNPEQKSMMIEVGQFQVHYTATVTETDELHCIT